jgi:hypothetical protein
MPKERFSEEQIVTLLRQIEGSMAQGKSTPEACRDAGIFETPSNAHLRVNLWVRQAPLENIANSQLVNV